MKPVKTHTQRLVGQVIDQRYRVLEPLAKGGMGSVLLGEQVNLSRKVAVKLVSSPDPRLVERFRREAAALAEVAHPAIVEIYDFIAQGDRTHNECYLVMAYIDGVNLEDYLHSNPNYQLPPDEVAQLILPIASALVELHKGGIIHRDIKPANIVRFVRADNRPGVKLVDFGIARSERDPNLTSEGLILGTPPYLAAEVLLGKKHSASSDIYALGATMFELLTGDTPFGKKNLHSIMRRAVTEEATLPSTVASTPLGELVLAMVKREDEERPDALAVTDILEEIVSGIRGKKRRKLSLPGLSGAASAQRKPLTDPGTTASPRPSARRFNFPALIAGAVAAILLIVLIIVLMSGGGTKRSGDDEDEDDEPMKKPMATEVMKAAVPSMTAMTMNPAPMPTTMKEPTPPPMTMEPTMAEPMPPPMRPEPMPPPRPRSPYDGLPTVFALRKKCVTRTDAVRYFKIARRNRVSSNKRHEEYARRIFHSLLMGRCASKTERRWSAYNLTYLYIRRRACSAARSMWRIYLRYTPQRRRRRRRPAFPKCP